MSNIGYLWVIGYIWVTLGNWELFLWVIGYGVSNYFAEVHVGCIKRVFLGPLSSSFSE